MTSIDTNDCFELRSLHINVIMMSTAPTDLKMNELKSMNADLHDIHSRLASPASIASEHRLDILEKSQGD